MKSPLAALATIATLAILGIAAPAYAQDGARVQLAIEQTDDLIARAQTVVAGADNSRAQIELDAAVGLEAQARTEFAAGHFLIALDLTTRARAHAGRAIALIAGLPDPDRVLAQLERTRELLDRAKERIEECDNDRARALLSAAVEMQTRAEGADRDGRFLAALQLTMSARERGLRAMRLCNSEDNMHEAADRALTRSDQLIARAKDVVAEHDRPPAQQALGRAIELENEAWVQFRADHLEASLRLTQSARTFAHRAIRLAGGS
ncbi:MAG: hypothetical protein HY076_07830 [Candidatus Eisenbacteria bacterium]|uniref:DUF4398 domain-containing protein n=1 Tax=Eiseniibacteriota bacterium TaxID=2212470 RepID=A0A9D6L7Q9_UNCEI|nr:hypothetical protein [Candidatus Eisenbacteria bacterium]MBI3540166.1 hypothetical protein [Candidatus Eisenbacteria bacterium]